MNAQNIRDYNFRLAANSTQNLDVPGDYLKVISATGAIRVRTVEGWMKDLLPGQGVKGLNFQRLILEDRSGSANVGTIAVGIGADSIVDDRITGSVEVIDGGKSRTLTNQAYNGYVYQTGAAGQYPHVQIWNPISATTRVIIKQFRLGTTTAGFISFGIHNAEFTVNQFNVRNKLSGGANGVAFQYSDSLAAQTMSSPFESLPVSANVIATVTLVEPIVLLPGFGFVANHGTVATFLTFGVELTEEANV
jgi:hypothetical protein